jgi:hypothetical protein
VTTLHCWRKHAGACDCEVTPVSIPQPTPHVCPKCGGNGTMDGSNRFLNPTQINCWPCQGTGILWYTQQEMHIGKRECDNFEPIISPKPPPLKKEAQPTGAGGEG